MWTIIVYKIVCILKTNWRPQWEYMPILTRKMRNNSNENNFGSSNLGEPGAISRPITEHGEFGHNGLHSNLNPNFLEVILRHLIK